MSVRQILLAATTISMVAFTMAPASAQTLRYARTAPKGEIKRYDAGHFDFYVGEPFEALVRDQVEFLNRQLQPAGAVV